MRRFVVLVAVLVLAGCLPDPLPVGKIPQLEEKITVSSQLISDEAIVVLLTKSFGALEASGDSDPEELLDQIAINDALVVIEGNGTKDTLTFIETGLYSLATGSFVADQVYTLYVESPAMGKVSATAQVKQQAVFDVVEARIYDTGFDTLATISFSFNDLPGRNHYMINVQHITEEAEPDDFLNPAVFTYLFTDLNMEGQTISDEFNAFFRRDFIPGDTVMVQLGNVSQEYYDFLELRKDTRFNFSDFLGEPVNYPSNVKGGLGWFTLHLPDVRLIEVEE